MARVSKKIAKSDVGANSVRPQNSEKTYKTAIYARISIEDSSAEGGTIDNQILLVRKYIESKPYLKLCDTFIDNGQTGTNFERKGFQNLMEAIKRGEIDCIVVKDLSRFARDYIEAGNYLEKVFPFMGVRFIAVNDGYDSHDPARKNVYDLTIVLKNFINDTYAKDISRKVRSTLKIKQQKGEYTGSRAPYGYMKSPEDKHKLIVDEETAPIVKNIYKWKLDGMSDVSIVRKLEDLKISSPSNYFYSKGLLCHERYAKKILWNKKTVQNILTNYIYIGHMAQGKAKSRIDAGLKPKRITQNNWIIVENTHEPIIETEMFYAVKNIIEKCTGNYRQMQKSNKSKEDRKNIFAGFIKCADCGKNLIRKETKSNSGKPCFYFCCPTYQNHLSNGCVKKSVSESKLKKAILIVIQKQIEVLTKIENNIKNINSSPQVKAKESSLYAEYQTITQKLSKIDTDKNILYNDFKDGLLDEKEYKLARNKCETDGNNLSSRLNEISAELKKYSAKVVDNTKYTAEMRKFSNEDELSREMLTALIECITLYSDKRIEIMFNYQDELEQLKLYIEEAGRLYDYGNLSPAF